jgi:hypothetical protein
MHTLANASDTALARRVLLSPSEMPASWRFGSQSDYSPDELKTVYCLNGYPGYVAGSSVDYGYKVDPNGRGAEGQLEVDVKLTNSEADANKQLQMLRSAESQTPPGSQCFLDQYRGVVADAVGLDNLLPGSALLPRANTGVALAGLIIRASVPYKLNGDKVMFIDDVRIQKGRIVARMLFLTCCQPFDYATVEAPLIKGTATHVDSLAPGA